MWENPQCGILILCRQRHEIRCQVGVLPLGTGNDLARCLGWGTAVDDENQLPLLLERFERAHTKMLDRWSIMMYESKSISLRSPSTGAYQPIGASTVTQYEAFVGMHLTQILSSEDHRVVISSAKVLCETIGQFLAKIGEAAASQPIPQPVESPDDSIACKCQVLQEKLESLLKTLHVESQIAAADAMKEASQNVPPMPIDTDPSSSDSVPEMSPPPLGHKMSVGIASSVLKRRASFAQREALMSRANSLKKAIRQIIEHAEKALDEQNSQPMVPETSKKRSFRQKSKRKGKEKDNASKIKSDAGGPSVDQPKRRLSYLDRLKLRSESSSRSHSPSGISNQSTTSPTHPPLKQQQSPTSPGPSVELDPQPNADSRPNELQPITFSPTGGTLSVPAMEVQPPTPLCLTPASSHCSIKNNGNSSNGQSTITTPDKPSMNQKGSSTKDGDTSSDNDVTREDDDDDGDDEDGDYDDNDLDFGGEAMFLNPDDAFEPLAGPSTSTADRQMTKGARSAARPVLGVPWKLPEHDSGHATDHSVSGIPAPHLSNPPLANRQLSEPSAVLIRPEQPAAIRRPVSALCESVEVLDEDRSVAQYYAARRLSAVGRERLAAFAAKPTTTTTTDSSDQQQMEQSSTSSKKCPDKANVATLSLDTAAMYLGLQGRGNAGRCASDSSLKVLSQLTSPSRKISSTSTKRSFETRTPSPTVGFRPAFRRGLIATGLTGGSLIADVLLLNADILGIAAPLMDFPEVPMEEYVEKKVMNNYFGIGLDAKISLEFNTKRNEYSDRARSRSKLFMWYGMLGTKELIQRTYRNLEQRVHLECDGHRIPLPSLQGVVVLNIPSYQGGAKFWSSSTRGDEAFTVQAFDDKILEVVAIFGVLHCATSRVISVANHRIAQCRHVKIIITGDEPIPVQVDGEAWMQAPGYIQILPKNRAQVLVRNRQFEATLKTWKERQRLEQRSPGCLLHIYTEAETESIISTLETFHLFINWIKRGCTESGSLDKYLGDSMDQAISLLHKLYPTKKLSQLPHLSSYLVELLNVATSLFTKVLSFMENNNRRSMDISDEVRMGIESTLGVFEGDLMAFKKVLLLSHSSLSLDDVHVRGHKLPSTVSQPPVSLMIDERLPTPAQDRRSKSKVEIGTQPTQGECVVVPERRVASTGTGLGLSEFKQLTLEHSTDVSSPGAPLPETTLTASDSRRHSSSGRRLADWFRSKTFSTSTAMSHGYQKRKKGAGRDEPSHGNVGDWTTNDVARWLDSIELSQYSDYFITHDIRGTELLQLERGDLKELGVQKVGHIKRLQQAIESLNKEHCEFISQESWSGNA